MQNKVILNPHDSLAVFGFDPFALECPGFKGLGELFLRSIDICPNSDERSYEDAGRCIFKDVAMPWRVPLRLDLGILIVGGTRSCIAIGMANGVEIGLLLGLTALNFVRFRAFKLAGSNNFCREKRHIDVWLPAFWRVQFGMGTGTCLGEVEPDRTVVGVKGRVNVYRSCSKERFEFEERGLSTSFGSSITPRYPLEYKERSKTMVSMISILWGSSFKCKNSLVNCDPKEDGKIFTHLFSSLPDGQGLLAHYDRPGWVHWEQFPILD